VAGVKKEVKFGLRGRQGTSRARGAPTSESGRSTRAVRGTLSSPPHLTGRVRGEGKNCLLTRAVAPGRSAYLLFPFLAAGNLTGVGREGKSKTTLMGKIWA